MRLVTFSKNRKVRIGVFVDDDKTVVDLSVAAPTLPTDMNGFIAAGPKALAKAAAAVKKAKPEPMLQHLSASKKKKFEKEIIEAFIQESKSQKQNLPLDIPLRK